MNYNFELLNKSEKTNAYITKLIINVPKNKIILKNNIEMCLYNQIYFIHVYTIETTDRIKVKSIKDILINLSMLDYYMGVLNNNKYITPKRFNSVCNYLTELKKICYGLIKRETIRVQ